MSRALARSFLVTSDDKLVAFTDSSKPAPRSGDTVIGLLAATRRAADESSDSSALKA